MSWFRLCCQVSHTQYERKGTSRWSRHTLYAPELEKRLELSRRFRKKSPLTGWVRISAHDLRTASWCCSYKSVTYAMDCCDTNTLEQRVVKQMVLSQYIPKRGRGQSVPKSNARIIYKQGRPKDKGGRNTASSPARPDYTRC